MAGLGILQSLLYFIFLFDVGFYCDIFTNIHATLLVFIVISKFLAQDNDFPAI